MKQTITIALLLCSIGVFAQTKDTTRYHFTETDAVLRVDSLIKAQYNKYHPVKEQPKKK